MFKNQSHMTTKMKPKDIFQIYQKIHKAVYDFCQSYRHLRFLSVIQVILRWQFKLSFSHIRHFMAAQSYKAM